MVDAKAGRGLRDSDFPAQMLGVYRRHRRMVVGMVLAIVALVALYTVRATPVYEAMASIRIDKERPALPGLDVLETLSKGSEIGTEMTELGSRTLAEEVVRTTALQLRLADPGRVPRAVLLEDARVDPGAPEGEYELKRESDGRFVVRDRSTDRRLDRVSVGERVRLPGVSFVLRREAAEYGTLVLEVDPFEDVVEDLQETLEIERAPREANIILIRYRDADRRLVRDVPNALLEHFIARRQHVRQTEARSTVAFLGAQLETLSAQLEQAEEALRRFRESQQVVSPVEEAKTQLDRLAELQARRSTIETERAALGALLDEIRRTDARGRAPSAPSPYRRLIGFPTILRNPAAAELLRSLVAVESQRTELLVRRNMSDPDVRVYTARIEALENELRAIAETYHEGLENEAASLDLMLGRFADRLEELPDREMRFARLQREAEVLSEIYTLLRTRLKEAEIAQAVEDPSARIVDPAIVPTDPVRPRPVLNLVGAPPAPEVAALARVEGVRVTGRVPDPRPFLRGAALAVVPLRAGSGTRLKVLEAFAMGRAVVSTAIGCEGIEAVPGRHLRVADEPSAFAAAVVRLLRRPDERARLGAEARRLVEARYGWPATVAIVESVLEAAARGDAGREAAPCV